MEIILKKEIIDQIIEDIINVPHFAEITRQYLREHIDTDEIFQFFQKGVNKDAVIDLCIRATLPNIHAFEDIPHYVILMAKLNALKAIAKAYAQFQGIAEELTEEEQINLLIDIKNSDEIDTVQKIIATTLEDNFKK